MNRKKMIELFIYIVIVIIGIILLVTKPLEEKKIDHNVGLGGVHSAIISVQ